MAEQSRAEGLFEKIKSAGDEAAQAAALRKLATDRTAEDEYVEFKSGIYNEKDTGKYWSQALSAFANTEGGVLIFGIKTDKVDTGGTRPIDTAVGVELVDKPEVLEQFLKDTRLNSTVDPVPGVQYLRVTEPGGKGFVVAYIPEGPHKPYRAASDPSRNYFHRVGDSFAIINHSYLRTLFYPRLRSNLTIEIVPSVDEEKTKSDSHTVYRFSAKVTNTGNSSARDMKAAFTCNRVIDDLPHNAYFKSHNKNGLNGARLYHQYPIHPGEGYHLFNVSAKYGIHDLAMTTKFEFSFFMTDQEPLYFTARFDSLILREAESVIATPVDKL